MAGHKNLIQEKLADYAHNAWCGWMNYMFSKGTFHDDNTFTLPSWAVERWRRQAATSYDELPESEKNSDRKEADKMIELIG